MTKTEIKNLIKKEWDNLDNLIKNPNTLSTDNEKLLTSMIMLKSIHSFILDGLFDDDVTKEHLHEALKNVFWSEDYK